MDNRGVSNVLGYVLLFGVVFMSIAAVGTAGVDSLTAARDGTMAMNAEHTMTGIGSAIEDVHKENVSRTSRVRLGSGSLEPGGTTTVEVDFDPGDGTTEFSQPTQSIVHAIGDSRIVYVAGAVFRLQSEGEAVVHEPNYRLSNDGTVLQILATEPVGPTSTVSGSNALVSMNRKFGSATIETHSDSDVDAAMTFRTPSGPQAKLWKRALEDEFTSGCSLSGSNVTCTQDSSSPILVRSTVTEFELSS